MIYLKLHPNHFDSFLLKGKIYYSLKNFTNSFISYDKCLLLNPQSQEALLGKAYCLKELKYYEEAIEIFRNKNQESPSAKV